MRPQRRGLLLAATAVASFSLVGCANPTRIVSQRYTESVGAVLISQDGRHLVVLGERYHYIFDAPAALVQALASPLHGRMAGVLAGFQVNLEGTTRGDYDIRLPGDLDETASAQAAALGFQADPTDGALHLSGRLQGRRFLEGALRARRTPMTLNQVYQVEITAEQRASEQAADALVSPITVAAEGVTMLYYIVLAPVLIPLALISREPRR